MLADKWETSGAQSVLGDNRETSGDTSLKSRGQRIESAAGEKLREKCKITQAKNPECSGENWETRGETNMKSFPADKWETNVKSCGRGIQNVVGRKTNLETNVKIMRPEHTPLSKE